MFLFFWQSEYLLGVVDGGSEKSEDAFKFMRYFFVSYFKQAPSQKRERIPARGIIIVMILLSEKKASS